MKLPIYCIIKDRIAVKAVRTEDGGSELLEYIPEDNEFRRNMQFLDYIFLPSPSRAMDTEFVSKSEFKAYVDRLRGQARAKRILSPTTDKLKRVKNGAFHNNQFKDKTPELPEQSGKMQKQNRKWTLERYDWYACEFYKLKGEYATETDAIAAAKKRNKENGYWIYVVAPDGSDYRFSE